MRNLEFVEEFRQEAQHALFTKKQAVAVTMRLLEEELKNDANTEEEQKILEGAMQRIDFHYLDTTNSLTDEILDAADVARINAENIADAIDVVVFETKGLE